MRVKTYLSEVEPNQLWSDEQNPLDSASRINLTSWRDTRIRSKGLFFEKHETKKKKGEIGFCFEKSTNAIHGIISNYVERELS